MSFWSSGILAGNQTADLIGYAAARFWSSDILAGNQTEAKYKASHSKNRRGFE